MEELADQLPKMNLVDFGLWLVRKRVRFKITGRSMMPLLMPGDEILMDLGAYRKKNPQPGDIVVAYHPLNGDLKIIKRIGAVKNGHVFDLIGDNPSESTDYDSIPFDRIIGKVTSIFLSARENKS